MDACTKLISRPPPAPFSMVLMGTKALLLLKASAAQMLCAPNWHRNVNSKNNQPTKQIKSPGSFHSRGHNIFQQFISISFPTPSLLEGTAIPSALHRKVCQIPTICSITHPWWSFHSYPSFVFYFWKPVSVLFYSPDCAY